MDVLRIFDNSNLGSYYRFLVKYEPDYKVRLSEKEAKVVEFISKKLASGKRIHELELLGRMLYYKNSLISDLRNQLQDEYDVNLDPIIEKSVINVMTNEFPSGSGKKTYEDCVFLTESKD